MLTVMTVSVGGICKVMVLSALFGFALGLIVSCNWIK